LPLPHGCIISTESVPLAVDEDAVVVVADKDAATVIVDDVAEAVTVEEAVDDDVVADEEVKLLLHAATQKASATASKGKNCLYAVFINELICLIVFIERKKQRAGM
jgi:hypothetical protein